MTETELRRLIAAAMRVPLDEATTVEGGEELQWDSLAHIQVVFLLEDCLDIRLSADEIEVCRTYPGVVDTLSARGLLGLH